MDTGLDSAENRCALQGAGDAVILGEKMRLGTDGSLREALTRAGRCTTLANGLQVKEVIINPGSVASRRFVVVHNSEQAERDAAKRADDTGGRAGPNRLGLQHAARLGFETASGAWRGKESDRAVGCCAWRVLPWKRPGSFRGRSGR